MATVITDESYRAPFEGPDPLADLDDCTAGQRAVLLAVRLHGPIAQSALWRQGVVANGTVSNAARELVASGLLDREETATGAYLIRAPGHDGRDDPAPFDGVDALPPSQVAIVLGVRLAGPIAQHRLRHLSVASKPGGSTGVRQLVDAGVLDRREIARPQGGFWVWDPDRQDPPEPALRADGGEPIDKVGLDHPTTITDRKVYLTGEQVAQLDTLVDLGIYANRSEAVRSAVRRELRLQADDPDDVARTLQRLYDRAMQGRRPETIGTAETLADLLGVDLERRVEP